MNQDDLTTLKNWFDAYCASFSTPVPEDQLNITIKRDHTREVCENAVRIARDLGLDQEGVLLAEAIALFHDVGRFPQYRRYKTYNDSRSTNHAALGAKVLLENNVLRALPKHEQDLIVRSVTLHNVYALPEQVEADLLLHVKLVRDADKLDIWRVFLEYYSRNHEERQATAVALGLPDSPEYSSEVLACLLRGTMIKMSELRTLNDFKLLQVSWIYDLNFACSLRLVRERDILNKMAKNLPDSRDVRRAVDKVRTYLDEKR